MKHEDFMEAPHRR